MTNDPGDEIARRDELLEGFTRAATLDAIARSQKSLTTDQNDHRRRTITFLRWKWKPDGCIELKKKLVDCRRLLGEAQR